MFIQTETTPNPNSLKFLPGRTVMDKGTAMFTAKEEAKNSLLATQLFTIPNVEAVFFSSDFITVTKQGNSDWDVLKPEILTLIMEFFLTDQPVIQELSTDVTENNDSEIILQIKEIIETRVRPAVAEDGGDIIFHSFDEASGVVKLELHGSCSGCPSATVTLKEGIENMLKHYVPEVTSVEAV